MKKLNQILNYIIGAFIGTFIGHALYTYWDYCTHPEVYMIYSAPWYTAVLVNGLGAGIIILICIIIKLVIRNRMKRED